MKRWILTTLLAGLLACLAACGGGKGLPAAPEAGPDQTTEPGLPGLDNLPQPSRSISSAANGFLSLDPLDMLLRAHASDGGGFLLLDNTSGVPAFALYGVYGFDGDNYPASVKLDVGSSLTKFYLAFSDYAQSRWAISGPFTGTGEYDIPALDGNTSRTAFTSPSHTHYFAIIVDNGGKLAVNSLALGVSGGDNAPEPVYALEGSGGAGGFYLTWNQSASYLDPDFAGYILERAPEFGGSYAPLDPAISNKNYFKDQTAVLDTLYRYRVRTSDLAGNSSTSGELTLGPKTGQLADPVVVLKPIPGHFFGPASVTIDLSDSFDPEGQAISTYSSVYYNGKAINLTDPVQTVLMQPGCYQLQISIQTADARFGFGYARFKVYPAWQNSSTVLRATNATGSYKQSRLGYLRGGIQPSDGRLTLAAADFTLPGLSLWHFDGSAMVETRVPALDDIRHIGEPLTIGNSLVFPVSEKHGYYLVEYDGTSVNLTSEGSTGLAYPIAMAQDGTGAIWWIANQFDGALHHLYIHKDLSSMDSYPLGASGNAFSVADIAYDAGSGHFWVFVDLAGSLIANEWDPVTKLPVSGGVLASGAVASMDAEINPENGRVGLLYCIGGQQRYRERDGLGSWTPEQIVDNSSVNKPPADLAPSADGKLNAFFALNSGQAHRYIYSGGSWSLANTVQYSTDSAYDCCLLPVSASPDMRVADICHDGVVRLARLNDNDTDNNFTSIDTAVGQGFDMHAAAGSDGLHVIWLPSLDNVAAVHMLSAAGAQEGSDWAEAQGFQCSSGLNLASNMSGEVYASGFDGGFDKLMYWDPLGASFIAEIQFPSQSKYRPILGNQHQADTMIFSVWDDGIGGMHKSSGHHGSIGADSQYVPDSVPVYDGAYTRFQPLEGFICGSGATPDGPQVSYMGLTGVTDPLYKSLAGGIYSPFDKDGTVGRVYAAGISIAENPYLAVAEHDWLVAGGPGGLPVRCTTKYGTTTEVAALPIGGGSAYAEERSSVSVGTMPGLTCVNLVASIDGSQSWFEWSNFGHWEQLPLPPGLDNMSLPLIVAGSDGRWHLIYKDWKTDAIMCRSTL